MEIYGTSGTIFENHMWDKPVRLFSFSCAMGDNRRKWFEPDIEHGPFPHYYTISVRHEDEHFARCVLEDKEPEFSPEDAKSAVECVLTGYLSAIQGKQVTREELIEYARQNGSASIFNELGKHIVIRPGLPEVRRVEPLGINRERAVKVMQEHGLDLLIATSPVNVYYLSGLPVLPSAPNPILFALMNMYPNIALLRWDGHICLLHWGLFRSTEEFCWANEYKGILSQKDAKRSAWSKLKKWGARGKRVGLESTAPKFLIDHLSAKDPDLELVTADDVFLELRLVKTPAEIALIEKATEISEKAIHECVEMARVGVSDNELLRHAKMVMLNEGADTWDHLTLSIGGSDPEAPGVGTKAKEGDILRFDFGAVCRGYVSDVNRHVVLGPIPDDARTLVERLIYLQEYYEKRVRPGVNIKEIHEEATAYYRSLNPSGFAMVTGHSIGLECEEKHLFGPVGVCEGTFEENMVFEIEAWEAYGDTLIGVEDCYVVTEEGLKRITSLDKRMISKQSF